MTRKRKRFQWEAYNPRTMANAQGVILAYEPESVENHLLRRGYEDPIVNTVRRRPPVGAGLPAAWSIDHAALAHACAVLGVSWPVEIRRTTARGHTGRHVMTERDYGMRHRITVNKLSDPAKASRTIIHELTHAAQAEAAGSMSAWHRRCKAEHRLPHRARPMEREAYANAERVAIQCAIGA
jgi:hypothetical protein